jgi:hypothetical protein
MIASGAVLISSLFFPSLSIAGGQADPLAYATTASQFGVVDLLTGVFTQRGTLGVTLSGLGEVGGKLYGGGYRSPTLYGVNPSTGALTSIGSTSFSYFGTGSTNHGLFALDTIMNLYSINPKTGAATLVGFTGLTVGPGGMSTGSDTLYITDNFSLYSIDTTTGAATLIGTSPSGLFVPTVVLKGTYKGGDVMFAGADSPPAIWIVNFTDGVGSFVADTTGANGHFYGLAPTPGE